MEELKVAMETWEQWFEHQKTKHGQCGGYTEFQDYVDDQPASEVIAMLILWGDLEMESAE